MSLSRPDLTGVEPEIVAYIEYLEEELEGVRRRRDDDEPRIRELSMEPSEPPTSINVISITGTGLAKRTPRHYYIRQRRGGMGVFDLDSPPDDPPVFLAVADEGMGIILLTNQARAFRVPLREIPETPVRGRGKSLLETLPLRAGEKLSLVFPDRGSSYLSIVSERGQIRRVGSQYLGDKLQPGTVLYDVREGGAPAAWCWSSGNDEIFIATRLGRAIRFSERQAPVRGCLGLRVDPEDRVVGVAATQPDGAVFMLTDDGKGTVRLMSGFTANKEPGTGGKVAMKTEELLGVLSIVNPAALDTFDVFTISELGKIIRFQAAEVPAKEGVVQGVNCMSLRSDTCRALTGCIIDNV